MGAGSLQDRLMTWGCSYIVNQIVWETATGQQMPFPNWTQSQKDLLNSFFDKLMSGDPNLGIHRPYPPKNLSAIPKPGVGAYVMFLTAQEAFDIYAAHVAHVFYLEATNKVPWSILNLPEIELAELLRSDRYHMRIVDSSIDHSWYPSHIQPNRDFQLPYRCFDSNNGSGLVCDPTVGFRFLHGDDSTARTNLIGQTEEETMHNLSVWCAANVGHGGDPIDSKRWHIIMHNFLEDRLRAEHRTYTDSQGNVYEDDKEIFAPNGCHSVANLLHDLARSVNIPLLCVYSYQTGQYTGRHQGLMYHWGRNDARFLYHTDELDMNNFAPFFPIQDDGAAAPQPMNEAQKKQAYFEVHWMPPTELAQWGFVNATTFDLKPNPNAGGNAVNADLPNLGVDGTTCPNSVAALTLDKMDRLGSWPLYLKYFCNNVFDYYIQKSISALSPKTLDQYRAHAAQCVNAYGGCSTLATQAAEFMKQEGSNVEAPPLPMIHRPPP
jgi:hypothetical protein